MSSVASQPPRQGVWLSLTLGSSSHTPVPLQANPRPELQTSQPLLLGSGHQGTLSQRVPPPPSQKIEHCLCLSATSWSLSLPAFTTCSSHRPSLRPTQHKAQRDPLNAKSYRIPTPTPVSKSSHLD